MTSTTFPRLGVAFVPSLPPEQLHSFAVTAETSGLDELWVWEDCFKESGVATAAAVLAWTERIQVGIGLLPVPLRNVALTAMEFATLDRLFPGRLIAGIGHGVQDWIGQAGARAESPLTLLTEYTTALRRLLAGERVTVEGRYVRLDDVALDWPPLQRLPLMLGGEGPKSLALAAREGDGNLLTAAMSLDDVKRACQIITGELGGNSAGRTIVGALIAATGEGAQQRVDNEVAVWAKKPGAEIGAAGDAAAIAEALRQLGALGVTSVMVQPTQDEPDLEGFIRFLGQEVRPLLS